MAYATPPEAQGSRTFIGERIVGQIVLTHSEIATFATLSGDLNPLHHDEAFQLCHRP